MTQGLRHERWLPISLSASSALSLVMHRAINAQWTTRFVCYNNVRHVPFDALLRVQMFFAGNSVGCAALRNLHYKVVATDAALIPTAE